MLVTSISGGTDVCTAFVGGCPLVPVRAGEISCRYLGGGRGLRRPTARARGGAGRAGHHPADAVDAGRLLGRRRRQPLPGRLLRAPSPACGRHGDWITLYADGACTITGRSDATLNRGGVRLGTAELYAVVEALPEVADSLVVHLEDGRRGPGG